VTRRSILEYIACDIGMTIIQIILLLSGQIASCISVSTCTSRHLYRKLYWRDNKQNNKIKHAYTSFREMVDNVESQLLRNIKTLILLCIFLK